MADAGATTLAHCGAAAHARAGRVIDAWRRAFPAVTVCRGSPAGVPETSGWGRRFDRSQKETIMHKAVLTAVAMAALSGSAVAQQGDISGQSPAGQQAQPQSPAFPGSPPALAGYQISPQQLSSSQVRAIQQALEDRGEEYVRVDGEWGPDTEAALKNFQKSENMIRQTGELDLPSIIALGLDPLSFGLAGASETIGQAQGGGAPPPERAEGTPEQTTPQNGGGQAR
jgi:hypothetical protein